MLGPVDAFWRFFLTRDSLPRVRVEVGVTDMVEIVRVTLAGLNADSCCESRTSHVPLLCGRPSGENQS